MGEGAGQDALIMPFISSANIACGLHAGDKDTMQQTIELALRHEVAIGAHPSFDDRKNFGRTEMNIGSVQLYDLITTQVHNLQQLAIAAGTRLRHVKPHGALYNMAAKDAAMSRTIATAVRDIDRQLVLFGLSNSHLISAAQALALQAASEVFADRTYQDDGSLTPRSQPNALIRDESQSIRQVLQMIIDGTVGTTSGKHIRILADTICLHGDGAHAAAFAERINHTLKTHHIVIRRIQ